MNNKRNYKITSDETIIKIRKEYIPGYKNGNTIFLREKYDVKKSIFNHIINDEVRRDLPLTADINPYFNGEKGTFTRGKCLSAEAELEIKEHLKTMSVKDIAIMYNVSKGTIYNLKKKL